VDDPTLNESYLVGLGLCTAAQLSCAQRLLAAVGEAVKDYLARAAMRLIDMKMEFGHDPDGQMVLIDEISQDCIRAVDDRTGRPLTKDVFRQLHSAEEVVGAYREFARRLNPAVEGLVWRPS
jgi:phosphoribosylaminoimidazole-succinocarboxamide synthase